MIFDVFGFGVMGMDIDYFLGLDNQRVFFAIPEQFSK
jgi:hypothetical protein